MASTKIAILGTGVLARQLIRHNFNTGQYAEIVCVIDISGQYSTAQQLVADLVYHIHYDTLYKRWDGHNVEGHNEYLQIEGKQIKCVVATDINNVVELSALDVDVLIDCSGNHDNGTIINGAWNAGARCCIATVPPTPTAFTNYYNNKYIVTPLNDVPHGISAYLCDGSLVARSIMSKIINDNQVINVAHFTNLKPNTNYLYVQDYANGDNGRDSRACDNIIYEGVSASDKVGQILPVINGKTYISTYRVVNKTVNETLCDFTVQYDDTIEHVRANIKGYSGDGYKYLLYDIDDTVSSDYEGLDYIGLNDNCISMTQNGTRVQVNMYYDAIMLQVKNIYDYVYSHSGDWTRGQ